jgi:iron complex transport system ATP-binding protein
MIRLNSITLYHTAQQPLLTDASARIAPGELVALIGRNGSGKSTLLRAMAGLGAVQGGTIGIGEVADVASASPAQMARTVALVTTERVRVSNLSCADVVAMGRAPFTNWLGHMQPDDRQAVERALEQVGMTEFASRTINSLSDGEMQRIMLARALAQDTPVILLDEPTGFLDVTNRRSVTALLASLAAQAGKTIIFSTHEIELAMTYATRIMLLAPPNLHLLPPAEMRTSSAFAALFR